MQILFIRLTTNQRKLAVILFLVATLGYFAAFTVNNPTGEWNVAAVILFAVILHAGVALFAWILVDLLMHD